MKLKMGVDEEVEEKKRNWVSHWDESRVVVVGGTS
jgi:hypothetical protein